MHEAPRSHEMDRIPYPSIANSDAAWTPFAHAAIDEAHRAVAELLADGE